MPRTYTDEEKAAWAAKMKAAREAKVQPTPTLDITREAVPTESDLLERIRRMFDEGNNPTQVRITSRQMMDILDNSNRLDGYATYCSPFGDIKIKVVPAKELE